MKNLTIEVWDTTDNKKQRVELPADATVNRVVVVLIGYRAGSRSSPG